MDMQFGFGHGAYDRAQLLVHHEVFLVGGEEKNAGAGASWNHDSGAASSTMYAVYRKIACATGNAAAALSARAVELSYDDREGAGKFNKNAVVFLILFNKINNLQRSIKDITTYLLTSSSFRAIINFMGQR
ncbi:hypothetical protein [Janthinobacterium psychrotolerans]|uniref:hypothetical protein n=1 Tax=Janthinobacterium psychrotolerans TaxID=1747903 RepID=UPI0014956E39|nr:hypothetical protein [Janthinobacterium psychrotolerans]